MLQFTINDINYSNKLRRDSLSRPDRLSARSTISLALTGESADRPAVGQKVELLKNRGINLYGVTETLNPSLTTYNVIGVTETPDENYSYINVVGLTETYDTDYEIVNVYGITSSKNNYDWVWGEGITELHGQQEKVFAGTIDSLDESEHGDKLIWQLDCVDYNQLCDRFVVPESYQNKTLGYIAKDINSQFMSDENISDAGVEDGPVITEAIFGYDVTVNKAFNRLSDITGYFWNIDYDKVLHFENRTTNTAEFDIDNTNRNIYDFKVRTTREDYRNQQYIRAGEGISNPVTDSFAGDGEQRTFHVRREIATEPTISINSVELPASDVGILNVEEGKKWYWNKGKTAIVQADTENKLTGSDILDVNYQYFYPIRVFSENVQEVKKRKGIEGGSGRYINVIDRPSIKDTTAAEEEAGGLLGKYGDVPEIITYYTFEEGLKAGQLQNIVRSKHNINGQYLISEVTLEPAGYNEYSRYRYSVKALSGDNVGGWIDFFKKMAEQGKEYIIRENEVIVKLKTFNEQLNISDSLAITKAAPNSELPFIVGFWEVG